MTSPKKSLSSFGSPSQVSFSPLRSTKPASSVSSGSDPKSVDELYTPGRLKNSGIYTSQEIDAVKQTPASTTSLQEIYMKNSSVNQIAKSKVMQSRIFELEPQPSSIEELQDDEKVEDVQQRNPVFRRWKQTFKTEIHKKPPVRRFMVGSETNLESSRDQDRSLAGVYKIIPLNKKIPLAKIESNSKEEENA